MDAQPPLDLMMQRNSPSAPTHCGSTPGVAKPQRSGLPRRLFVRRNVEDLLILHDRLNLPATVLVRWSADSEPSTAWCAWSRSLDGRDLRLTIALELSEKLASSFVAFAGPYRDFGTSMLSNCTLADMAGTVICSSIASFRSTSFYPLGDSDISTSVVLRNGEMEHRILPEAGPWLATLPSTLPRPWMTRGLSADIVMSAARVSRSRS